MKKAILIFFVAVVAVLAFYFFENAKGKPFLSISEIEELAKKDSNMEFYAKELKRAVEEFKEDDPKSYSALGLAWKGVADQTNNEKYYKNALLVYQEAIDLTNRKNTLFILNAGNMASYLGDYELAEKYYEEATYVAPGDQDGYIKLYELYRYKLGNPKDKIIAVLDRGIDRMVNPAYLKQLKDAYLSEEK